MHAFSTPQSLVVVGLLFGDLTVGPAFAIVIHGMLMTDRRNWCGDCICGRGIRNGDNKTATSAAMRMATIDISVICGLVRGIQGC